MADVIINYEGNEIASMSASGTKTLLTAGKYCDDNIEVVYTQPSLSGYTADDWLDNANPAGPVHSDAATITRNLSFCTGITEITLPNATSIPSNFAEGCVSLQKFVAPNLTTKRTGILRDCGGIINPCFLPLYEAGENSFRMAHIPIIVVGGIPDSYVCMNNSSLTACDILGGSKLGGSQVFANCALLDTLILRANSVLTLTQINCFTNTKFASDGTGGTLYVPSSLIASYQAAANWSTILGYANNSIVAIEGTYYETHYADGTTI